MNHVQNRPQNRPNFQNRQNNRNPPVNQNGGRQEERQERAPRRPQHDISKTYNIKATINQEIGPEAVAYLEKKKFRYLQREGKLYINQRIPHGHGLGAFGRANAEQIAIQGLHPYGKGISYGANAARLHRLDDQITLNPATGEYDVSKAIDRVRAVCPEITPMDQVRKTKWTKAIENDVGLREKGLHMVRNTCFTCKGDMPPALMDDTVENIQRCRRDRPADFRPLYTNHLCQECSDPVSFSTSQDSFYYPGVCEAHEWRAVIDGTPAVISFFDYHHAISSGINHGSYWDSEGTWSYDPVTAHVYSDSAGNSEPYYHKVVQTGGNDSWLLKSRFKTYWLLFETVDVMWHRDVPYRTVTMHAIRGNDDIPPVRSHRTMSSPDDFYVRPIRTEAIHPILAPQGRANACQVSKIVSIIGEQYRTRTEEIQVSEDQQDVIMKRWRTMAGFKYRIPAVQAPVREVEKALIRATNMQTHSSAAINYTKLIKDRLSDFEDEDNPDFIKDPIDRILRAGQVDAAFMIAEVLGARRIRTVAENHHYSESINAMKESVKGIFMTTHEWLLMMAPIKTMIFIGVFLMILALSKLMSKLTSLIPSANALEIYNSRTGRLETEDFYFEILPAFCLTALLFVLAPKLQRKKYPPYGQLVGRCATDEQLVQGEVAMDPQWRIRDKEWMTKSWKDLPCECQRETNGIQIFPQLQFDGFVRPTIYHSCKRTAMAAALRNTSNKLKPEKAVMAKFIKYAKYRFRLIANTAKWDLIHIDVEKHYARYPLAKQAIFKKYYADRATNKPNTMLDSFLKLEIGPEKSRNICSMSDEMMCEVSATIDAFQKMMKEHLAGYTPDYTMEELGEAISLAHWEIRDPVPFSSDGSGFDLTQLKPQHELFTWMISEFLNWSNVTTCDKVDKERVIEYVKKSEILNINIARGAITYQAAGRASGHSWTSVANTMLMILYWDFMLSVCADVPRNDYQLFVKGDDVFGFIRKKYVSVMKSTVARYMADKMPDHITSYGLGQISKFLLIGNLEKHTFLNCNLMQVNHRIVPIMRLDVACKKFSWTSKFNKGMFDQIQKLSLFDPKRKRMIGKFNEHLMELLLAKTLSYENLMGKMPIFRELIYVAKRLVKRTEKHLQRKIAPDTIEVNSYTAKLRTTPHSDSNIREYERFLFDTFNLTRTDIWRIERRIHLARDVQDILHIPQLRQVFMSEFVESQ